jgi:PEP-CTERM motif
MRGFLATVVAAVTLLVLVAGGAQAAIYTYNDRNPGYAGNAWPTWSAAIGGAAAPAGANLYYTSFQDFYTVNSFTPQAPTYTYIPANLPGINMGTVNTTVTANNGVSGNGIFQSVVSATDTVRFDFASGVNALGGIWQLDVPPAYTPTGLIIKFLGMNGSVYGTETIAQLVAGTQVPEFWGWTFDSKISAMEVTTTEVNGQGFSLINLEYQAVPEPSTFLLFGAGIGGLMIWRRRK